MSSYNKTVNGSVQSLISKNLTNAVGLDYDWKDQKIYWSDVTSDKGVISRMDFNGSNVEVIIVGARRSFQVTRTSVILYIRLLYILSMIIGISNGNGKSYIEEISEL